MWRVLARLGVAVLFPFAIAIAGLVPLDDSPLDWARARGLIAACSTEAKTVADRTPPDATAVATLRHCKAVAGFKVLVLAALFSLVVVLLEYEKPIRELTQLRDFRPIYLDSTLDEFRRSLVEQCGRGIRVNVMLANRRWFTPWQRYFRFEYQRGFEPPYDVDLTLKLRVDQGVAGEAFTARQPRARLIDRDWAERQGWRLTEQQKQLTAHVRWILSVPIYRFPDNNKPAKILGVINLDVTDPNVAPRLATEQMIKSLTDYLAKIGVVAAHLW